MDKNTQIWRQFYRKSITKPHLPRTECVVELNESDCYVAIDCGCGKGSDIEHLALLGYQTHGFDINTDAISICTQRFKNEPLVIISQAAFENFEYLTTGQYWLIQACSSPSLTALVKLGCQSHQP